MTETRFVKCGKVGYTIVCYSDDTVGILASDGTVITGGPIGGKLSASETRRLSDAELCRRLKSLEAARPGPA